MEKSGNGQAVREPVQQRSIAKKEEIIRAACLLFSTSGYPTASIRSIAKAADVSIGTIYSYFHDKMDVFISAANLYGQDMYDRFLEAMNREMTGVETIEEAILVVIDKFKEIISENMRFHVDMITLALTDETFRGIYASLENRTASAVADLFYERFKDDITVHDREIATFVVHKAIEEIVQYTLFFKVDLPEDKIQRELARMVAGYLKNDSWIVDSF